MRGGYVYVEPSHLNRRTATSLPGFAALVVRRPSGCGRVAAVRQLCAHVPEEELAGFAYQRMRRRPLMIARGGDRHPLPGQAALDPFNPEIGSDQEGENSWSWFRTMRECSTLPTGGSLLRVGIGTTSGGQLEPFPPKTSGADSTRLGRRCESGETTSDFCTSR